MKELSIEEKAKRFDKGIEKLRNLHDNYDTISTLIDIKEELENIFPELKVSDSEKIRNFISNELACLRATDEKGTVRYNELTEAIAWLEAHEEQVNLPHFTFDDVLALQCAMGAAKKVQKDEDLYKQLESLHDRVHDAYWIEKQGEQRPVEEKVWSIYNAKNGDVLNSERVQATIIFKGFADDGKHIIAYCALQKGIFISQELLWDRDFEPASEFWKNALYDAMTEKGYEWDADKKELKKIEPNPTWSEEDDDYRRDVSAAVNDYFDEGYAHELCNWLKSLKDRIQPNQEWSEEDSPYYDDICEILINLLHSEKANINKDAVQKDLDWLKSLHHQSHWKPSEEQINSLERILKFYGEDSKVSKSAEQLLEQLKGL